MYDVPTKLKVPFSKGRFLNLTSTLKVSAKHWKKRQLREVIFPQSVSGLTETGKSGDCCGGNAKVSRPLVTGTYAMFEETHRGLKIRGNAGGNIDP